MKCPNCQLENREGAKFCLECGEKLELDCAHCGKTFPLSAKFCDECGQRLGEVAETKTAVPEAEGERKHVTVFFSDLSGYTAMSEKLDPEDVKEITSRIFNEITQVITKYDGFVEKFVGDAVMAIFGVPKAHEDDPLRAIRAAREIHDLVDHISPELEERVGRPLSMHSGINTGLVVTGEVNLEQGTHGLSGDAINTASRLQGMAKTGEILVGYQTYRQTEGYFDFRELETIKVKGKERPIRVYKVLSQKDRPVTTHRLSGVRADLIGREVELTELREAVDNLGTGKGRIFSICGDAGTGKSRLVEEFKSGLDLEKIQWLEGHAYPYSQNIPYYPMIDLMNRVFLIEEGDSGEEVRKKVESGLGDMLEKKEGVVPYIGSLYSLSYPEIEEVSPEFWKLRLRDALQMILTALSRRTPTVYFLEDLHWADPSFVELLRHVLVEVRQPSVVLCVYRPVFSLFTTEQARGMAKVYHEIRLQDLSSSEAQGMLESLLKTDRIPSDLRRFVQDKAEGNPFYLEELVNSLIETETLIRDNGSWKVTKTITETDISSTINGVISGRLDRLENETKRVLQEASVIGRAFLYEILKRITVLQQDINGFLRGLEQLDIIRTRSLQPDLEYMFKHHLTREVVYSSLLKKERQATHKRIALVMEQLFPDRLPEFCETLAFHFKQGGSLLKAVDYLIKSGEKSLKRYAVEESHQYYKEAFNLLSNEREAAIKNQDLLIDLIIKWASVFYYRGDFKGLTALLSAHEDLAKSLDDHAKLGMFYAWYGFTLSCRERFKESYKYIASALQIGEGIENQQVIGYACTWLTWTCLELGLLEEAIFYGERAQEIYGAYESDPYIYIKSLGGLGIVYWYKGERKKTYNAGKALLDFGHQHSNLRSLCLGHGLTGVSYFVDGDFPSAIEHFRKTIQISADPIYSQAFRAALASSYLRDGQFQEAESNLQELAVFCREFGFEVYGAFAEMGLAIIQITKGDISEGFKKLGECQQACLGNERRYFYAMSEHMLGKLYSQIAMGDGEIKPSIIIKNIGFMVKDVPLARKKAENHFLKAIEASQEIGAKGIIGQANLDLGLLHKAKGRKGLAKECISEAFQIFEECEADVLLKQARDALASLE